MTVDASNILEFIHWAGLLQALVIIFSTWLFGRLIGGLTNRLVARFVLRRLLVEQVSALLRFFVYVLGGLAAVSSVFSLSQEVLAVMGGTIVVTVGLVLKDQAAAILAGVMILVEKPFSVGDRVSFGGYYGTITSIGLRSVRLVTLDDNEVSIPNSKFLSDPVASGNSGALTMLVQQDFWIGADQDFEQAKRIVSEALTYSPYFNPDKPWTVLTEQVRWEGMVSIQLRAKAYVLDIQYEKAFASDVAERTLRGLKEARIHPPGLLSRVIPVEAQP